MKFELVQKENKLQEIKAQRDNERAEFEEWRQEMKHQVHMYQSMIEDLMQKQNQTLINKDKAHEEEK